MYRLWNAYAGDPDRLFAIFVKYSMGREIIKLIDSTFETHGAIPDTEMYQIIRESLSPKDMFGVVGERARSAKRAKEILTIIMQLKKKKVIKKNKFFRKHLDIGCGKGYIPLAIQTKLGTQTCAIDIKDERDQFIKDELKCFKIYDGINIPYKGVDLVSIIMVLHHVRDLDPFLESLYTVLTGDGIVIVREHDAVDEQTRNLIHIQHEIFSAIYSKDAIYTYESGEDNYMSKKEIISRMKSKGFRYSNVKILFRNNPTNYFYIVFYK